MRPKHLALGLAALAVPFAAEALACGGCFSPPAPTADQTVVQNAERVLFVRDEKTKKSTVWVEVRYSGLAKDFGWVLPVPKLPKVGVGSTAVFDALDQRMQLRYAVQYQGPENCRDGYEGCKEMMYGEGDFAGGPQAGTSAADASASDDAGSNAPPSVQVLAQGTTGPYDYQVVASNDTALLYTWLNTRGYAIPEKSKPILQSHIDKGDKFVAIKLSNGQGVSAIRPVALEMEDAEPCVPLRLTSIAASEDLQVVVTVAGVGRAVVKNYLDVEVNPMRLNWMQYNNYVSCGDISGGYGYCTVPDNLGQVVSAAIDEAAGRAFVTEAALGGADLGQLSPLQSLTAQNFLYATNLFALGKLLLNLQGTLPLNDATADAMAPHLPLAKVMPGVAPLQALANLRACASFWQMFGPNPSQPCNLPGGTVLYAAALQAATYDAQPLADDVTTTLVKPIADVAAQLGDSGIVTRLAMRISPDEMDRDPIFAYNKALPKLSPVRSIRRNQVCLDGWNTGKQATRLTVDGLGSWVFEGDNNTKDPRFANAPAALQVRLQDETGPALEISADQVEFVDTAIKGAVPGKPSIPADLVLKTPLPWSPPKSDVLVNFLGPWKKPYSWCTPKDGWADGAMPPSGTPVKRGADAGPTSGPVPGVDAKSGWTDTVSPQYQPQADLSHDSDGGCTAQHTANATGWWLLLLSLGTLLGLRRRART